MDSYEDMFIIPECFVDTNLVETMLDVHGQATKGVNHRHGCNKVANTLKRAFNDRFAVAIIDNDKMKPNLGNLNKIAHSEHLTLFKHNTKPHYIIVVGKAMENFIISCANELSVDMEDYGFSKDLESFKKVTKNIKSKNDSQLKKLFKAIKDAKEMRIISKILCYFKSHRYDCNDEELKSFFN